MSLADKSADREAKVAFWWLPISHLPTTALIGQAALRERPPSRCGQAQVAVKVTASILLPSGSRTKAA